MKANTAVIAISLMFAFSCFAADSSPQEAEKKADMEKLIALMKAAEPYVSGMGKSASDVCMDMANDMVAKYGSQLSQLGKSPSDIRDSSYGICVNAVSSAENSQSIEEIDMWKTSALENVEEQLKNDTRSPSPKGFLIESINNSEKIARPFYFMKELSVKYNVH